MQRTIARQSSVLGSYLLVFLQMHLLGIAMLHRHGEMPAPWQHVISVSACEVQSPATSDSNLLCTACQIVQHSAAQPGSAAEALPSLASIPLVRRMVPSSYRSELPAMNHGRAPPLV